MDFKLKMKIGTGKEDAPVDNLNRTVIIGPNSISFTAPIFEIKRSPTKAAIKYGYKPLYSWAN